MRKRTYMMIIMVPLLVFLFFVGSRIWKSEREFRAWRSDYNALVESCLDWRENMHRLESLARAVDQGDLESGELITIARGLRSHAVSLMQQHEELVPPADREGVYMAKGAEMETRVVMADELISALMAKKEGDLSEHGVYMARYEDAEDKLNEQIRLTNSLLDEVVK